MQRWFTIRDFLSGRSDLEPPVEQFFEEIVYRKLVGERSEEMINNLEIFLREAVGKSYGLSTSKLLQRHTVKKGT